MIESRYKIEYVLPDDEQVKKSSPFRVLWYLLLIPIILLAVTAITYDFSIQNIHKDSLALFEKAKTHVFNLDTKAIVVNKNHNPKLNTPSIVKQRLPLLTAPSITKDEINTDKVIITELTAKQELQLKAIQEQIDKNSKLSINLNELSSQLALEKNINALLNNQLSQQEIDKLELSEKLNKILLGSANKENNEFSLINTPESSEAIIDKNESVNSVNLESQNINNKNITLIEDNTSIENTKNIEISETDKIIEAMQAIKPDTSQTVTIKEDNIEVSTEEVTSDESLDKNLENSTSLNNTIDKMEAIIPAPTIQNIEESMDAVITAKVPVVIEASKDSSEISETEKIIAAMTEINTDTNTEALPEQNKTNVVATSLEDDLDIKNAEKEALEQSSIEAEKINSNQELTTEKVIEKIQSENLAEITNEPLIEEQKISSEVNNEASINNNGELETEARETSETQSNSSVDAIIAAMEANQPTPSAAEKNSDLELKEDIKTQLVEQGDLSIDDK